MKLPDLPGIGFDGKPCILTNRQLVQHEHFEAVIVKGKTTQVRRIYGYVVAREVPA